MKIRALAVAAFVLLSSFPFLSPARSAVIGTGLSLYYRNDSSTTPTWTWTTPPPAFTTGTCFTSTGNINFNWGGGNPGGSCNNDYFLSYGVGYILAPATGTVTFCEQSDDEFYLRVNSTELIVDNSAKAAATGQNCNGTATMSMVAGSAYAIETWQHEDGGGAEWRLLLSYPGQSSYVIIPTANLNPSSFAFDPVVSLSAPATTVFRTAVTLTATSDSPGKITFYAGSKPIPGCISLTTTISGFNYVSTCNYRSASHATALLSFIIKPTNGANIKKSLSASITTGLRTTKR